MHVRRSLRIVIAIGLVTVLCASSGDSWGKACEATGDWKDISVLPTNGNHATNIKIKLSVDKEQVKPGDIVHISFEADRDCYLTLMDLNTEGQIVRLWPNDFSGTDNRVPANTVRQFPATNDKFRYRIAGPAGTERIIAYATSKPNQILTEQEFRGMQTKGFKQFAGNAKNLAIEFGQNTDQLAASDQWGTAQLNLCIREPEPIPAQPLVPAPSTASPPPAGLAPTTTPVTSPLEVQKKLFVLAVGASTGRLKYCESDAKKFTEAVSKKVGRRNVDVRMVMGPEAGYQGFVQGLNWLISRTQPEDSVVIYFNGHGSSIPDQEPADEPDGRDEAFVLYHTQPPADYREALAKRYIMVDDEFNVYFKKIPARQKILVADCCHSGTIHKESAADDAELVPKFYPLLDPESGLPTISIKAKSAPISYGSDNEAILAACMDNEIAYEVGSLKSSLFTHLLIKAINTGQPDLKKAFDQAKAETVQWIGKAVKQNKKLDMQTPSLIDPHGLLPLFTFRR